MKMKGKIGNELYCFFFFLIFAADGELRLHGSIQVYVCNGIDSVFIHCFLPINRKSINLLIDLSRDAESLPYYPPSSPTGQQRK